MPRLSRISNKPTQFPQKGLLFAVIIAVIAILNPILSKETFAVLSSCTATVSPTTVNTNTPQRFTFTMGSVSSVQWIKITRPSSGFTITGATASGWSPSSSASVVTFTLAGSGSTTLYIDATPPSSEAASANWAVQASDDAGGASPTTCTGTLGTAISGIGADVTTPTISGLTVSEITDSAAKITWTTNENSNSTVEYGTTAAYGSSKSDSASTTSHTINLTSLSKNTTYHFVAKSTDSSGNTGETDNSTLVTAKDATSSGTSTTTTVTKIQKDTVPPSISLKTDFKKAYASAPIIEGVAADDNGVARVEYSIDDGKNWLPVGEITGQFSKSTTFAFTPFGLEDGNYKVKVRAYDTTGNITNSKTFELVIDRLPPQVGSSLFTLGPLILTPAKNGKIYLLSKLDYKIVLSTVGGTTEITLTSREYSKSYEFSLNKNVDSGLWFGTLSFENQGEYKITAKSRDGAQNETERVIATVVVLPSGKTVDESQKPIKDAEITLYTFEVSQEKFVPWDSSYFNLINPQNVDALGIFNLIAAPGKYYLEVEAKGYLKTKSQIFETQTSLPINPVISLKKAKVITIGPFNFSLPNFQNHEIKVEFPNYDNEEIKDKDLLDSELEIIDVSKDREAFSTLSLRGKPTVLSVISSWSGNDIQQLSIIDGLSQNSQINFAPTISQEKPSAISILKRRAKLNIPIYTDPDGKLTEPLKIQSTPTHFFVNRKGVIKNIKYGVLTSGELLDNVVN